MATRKDLEFFIGDDPTASITVTRLGSASPLTGRRVELAVRLTRDTPLTVVEYQLSSVGASPKISITNGPGGLAVADFTGRVETPGLWWYRAWTCDPSGADVDRQTFNFGELKVTSV